MLEDPKMTRLFEHRYDDLEREFDLIWLQEHATSILSPLQLVDTYQAKGQDVLDVLNGTYVEDGYEGQMVRLDTMYQNKRTKYLLKRKEFCSDEFEVGGILEGNGNWKGCVKHLILRDHDGKVFKSGIRGSKEKLRAMWDTKQVPHWATVRYFMRTPDGVPRFPIAVDWGTGKRDD
jgi:DNA ligase-1